PAPALDRGWYVATQIAAYPLYLLRALVPVDPAFYRGQSPAPWPPDAATVLGWAAALALAVAALAWRRGFAEGSFAVAWMAACLLPSSSIVPLKEMVVDHRAYLGGAGVADALSWANLGAFYVERSRLTDAEAAMRRASWASPRDARIHDNLGMILQGLGREDDAVREFEAAVASTPALAQPRISLAAILLK